MLLVSHVTGTVEVSNFPASTEIANDAGNPVPAVLTAGTATIGRLLPPAPGTPYFLPMAERSFASQNSGSLDGTGVTRLLVDVYITGISGGVTPSLKVFVDRLDANGTWFPIWAPATMTTVGMTSTTIGPGALVGHDVGVAYRFRYETAGNVTFSASVRPR